MKQKILLAFTLLLISLNLAIAQDTVRVKDISQNLAKFKDEVVYIEGIVTQYIEGSAKTTAKYYLRGDWGQVIMVRTTQASPIVGKRYRIKGIVDFDDAFNEPFITESERAQIGGAVNGGGTSESVIKEDTVAPDKTLIFVLIGAAAVVLIILIVVLIKMRKPSAASAYVTPVPATAKEDVPEPERMVEGSTIKMASPPEGTLKLLPGRLKVVAGDDSIKEIRFYKIPNTQEVELTFGRAAGKPYTHIQLKPMTVSANQARVFFKEGQYHLENFSKTNPTRVNGQPVDVDTSVQLDDGDKVEMGEVVLEFNSK